jgi:general secretion pathway protein L
MPGKILGIDVTSDSVTAVQVEGGLRGFSITDWSRVVMEETGGLDSALRALSEQMDLTADTCISAISGEQISYRNLQMPFKDKKKISQTIAFTIETMLPFPIRDVLIDFAVVDQSDQSEILAATVRRGYVSEYLASLQSHGIDPDLVDASGVPTGLWLLNQPDIPDDGLLLQMGRKHTIMVLYVNKRVSLVRLLHFGDGIESAVEGEAPVNDQRQSAAPENLKRVFRELCTDVHSTLHGFQSQTKRTVRPEKAFITGEGSLHSQTEGLLEEFLEIPAERVNVARDARVHLEEEVAQLWEPGLMDSALALALRDSKKGPGFNFRTGEFEVRKKSLRLWGEIRKVAVFLIVIVCLAGAYFGVDYYLLNKRYRMLDEKIAEIYRQTFPDAGRIVNPIDQMKVKINEIKQSELSIPGIRGDQKVIDLLRDISLKIPASLDVTVTSMIVDPESVKMKGETDTFNTVDILKRNLEPSDYFSEVTISSANLDRSGKRVQFEMKMLRKGQ